MRIAIDFDNTLFKTTRRSYPDTVEPIPAVIDAAKKMQTEGHTLILFTCRTGEHLADAILDCQKQGLLFDEIAEKKPQADMYVDDRSLGILGFILMVNLGMLEEETEKYNRSID